LAFRIEGLILLKLKFLIAVRQADGQQLMSESGETTSHLIGFLYRTLRMIDNGMKVAFVFDGKPPDLKSKTLQGRFGRREEAREEEEEEKDVGEHIASLWPKDTRLSMISCYKPLRKGPISYREDR
jgi:5'-3' exonuclease